MDTINKKRAKLSPARPAFLASFFCLAAVLALSACSGVYEGLKPPTKVDVAEKAPVGLDIEVTDFKWTYMPGGQIQVTGRVVNKSGASQTDLNLFAMLFDEKGRAVAMGETRVSPSTLAGGQQGDFQLTVATSRPKGINHIRLLTNIKSGL